MNAPPGGRVERVFCKFAVLGEARGFEAGARWTAAKELQEEAGISLPPECFFQLDASPEHGGRHHNLTSLHDNGLPRCAFQEGAGSQPELRATRHHTIAGAELVAALRDG